MSNYAGYVEQADEFIRGRLMNTATNLPKVGDEVIAIRFGGRHRMKVKKIEGDDYILCDDYSNILRCKINEIEIDEVDL